MGASGSSPTLTPYFQSGGQSRCNVRIHQFPLAASEIQSLPTGTFLRDLIEIGHTFPLGISVPEQPRFAFKGWRCIGIECFVSVEKNLPFEVKEF